MYYYIIKNFLRGKNYNNKKDKYKCIILRIIVMNYLSI